MTAARRGHAGAIAPRTGAPPPRRHTTLARLVGATGLVLLTSLLFWLLTDDAFRVSEDNVRFEGLTHADEAAVRDHLSDLDRRPNVFRVRASSIVKELSTLTEVDAASAQITLPAEITVQLDERDPVFIWSNGARSWLVDEDGMLFAPADESTAQAVAEARAAAAGGLGDAEGAAADELAEADTGPTELDPALAARAALPLVEDDRLWTEDPTVGTYLPASDLAVMRLLLGRDSGSTGQPGPGPALTGGQGRWLRAQERGPRLARALRPLHPHDPAARHHPGPGAMPPMAARERGAEAGAGPAGALRRGLWHIHQVPVS